jgi:hypothetical protein
VLLLLMLRVVSLVEDCWTWYSRTSDKRCCCKHGEIKGAVVVVAEVVIVGSRGKIQ